MIDKNELKSGRKVYVIEHDVMFEDRLFISSGIIVKEYSEPDSYIINLDNYEFIFDINDIFLTYKDAKKEMNKRLVNKNQEEK